MAYITLPNRDVGDPVTKEWIDGVKNNFDDHETRLSEAEQNIAKVTVFNVLFLNAVQTVLSGVNDVAIFRADQNFTLTEAKIIVLEAGTSGTTQIDVLKSSTIGGTFNSVFSTKPSVAQAAGSNVESSNAVFSSTNVSTGDYIKLNIDSFQVSQKRIMIHVYGEAI